MNYFHYEGVNYIDNIFGTSNFDWLGRSYVRAESPNAHDWSAESEVSWSLQSCLIHYKNEEQGKEVRTLDKFFNSPTTSLELLTTGLESF